MSLRRFLLARERDELFYVGARGRMPVVKRAIGASLALSMFFNKDLLYCTYLLSRLFSGIFDYVLRL